MPPHPTALSKAAANDGCKGSGCSCLRSSSDFKLRSSSIVVAELVAGWSSQTAAGILKRIFRRRGKFCVCCRGGFLSIERLVGNYPCGVAAVVSFDSGLFCLEEFTRSHTYV